MAPSLKLAGVVLVCMAVVAAHTAEAAVTCGMVANSLRPCVPYLKGKGPLLGGCCNGVKAINNAARTIPDRRTACQCLKQTAGSITGIQPSLATGLASKCGVRIPYPISPSTDCNKIK